MGKPKSSTFCDLRNKEVVNIADGSRLGYVCDIEIDLECGRIIALIVPMRTKIFSVGKAKHYRIPWDMISRIGDDFILVCMGELAPAPPGK